MHIDIDILVYAAIAIAIFIKLWSVFGTRGEDEPQQPNPFVASPAPQPQPGDETFVPRTQLPPAAPPPASLAGGLQQVKTVDPSFDEKQFLDMARDDFTAIVEAYARGDMDTLAMMLAPALLAHFRQTADARKAQGQSAQTRVASIAEAEPVAARAEGSRIFVTVKFVSRQENILRDARGTVIGGEPGKTAEATDIWTFARDTAAPDSKWLLVETRG